MVIRRGLVPAMWLGLATCCPTLWIQVTKTEPAPWPELPTPLAFAPAIPTSMPNRFDVLEDGHLTHLADGYSDAIDARRDEKAQKTGALAELDTLLLRYEDTRLAVCLGAHGGIQADVDCSPADNCQALIIAATDMPLSIPHAVIVGDEARTILDIKTRTDGRKIIALGRAIPASDQPVAMCFADSEGLSKPLLSFVHASDIQLRDPSVVLTDRRISQRLDWFEPLASFEYDEDMAFYNQYLVEAMVATINAAAGDNPKAMDPEKPTLVMNTGDSIDSNMKSELLRFHSIIDRFRIPFYELFGNHDILVFGNLTPTDTRDNDKQCSHVASLIGTHTSWAPNKICVDQLVKRCPTCTGTDVEFVAKAAGHSHTRTAFMDEFVHTDYEPVAEPAPPEQLPIPVSGIPPEAELYCDDTVPVVDATGYTRSHGFDLGAVYDEKSEAYVPTGYYAFVVPLPDDRHRNAVFVALDSEELPDHEGGIYGRVGTQQLGWLRDVLTCVKTKHAEDLVFVFAHQPLSMIKVDDNQPSVEAVLDDAVPNVAGFFYGHHHKHGICRDTRDTVCTKYWEIETGSLVEFPQEARMVRLKQVGKQLAFLEVSTFGENLVDQTTTLAKYVELAHRGAQRDFCHTNDARCSEDKRVYREDGNHTAARLFFKLP